MKLTARGDKLHWWATGYVRAVQRDSIYKRGPYLPEVWFRRTVDNTKTF